MMITRECYGLRCILLAMVIFVSICSCSGQMRVQCSGRQFVTRTPSGSISYSPLPAGSGLVNSTYDPGVIGGWYSLARGFVDVVRPGSLPYDQLLTTLNSTGIQCTVGLQTECPTSAQNLDIRTTLTSFATWWVGILILTIIGGIVGVAYCIGGMCFCCCRCCGNCGGSKKQLVTDYMDIKTFVYTAILTLLLLLLFVGVVLAFFSNQQTYESVNNAQTTINSVFENGVDYVHDTIDELEELVCQLASQEGVAGLVIEEAENFNTTLQDLTTGIQRDVDTILNEVTVLTPGFNSTIDVLTSLTTTTVSIRTAGDTLTSTLNGIITDLNSVRTDCTAVLGTCNLPMSSDLQTGADFNQIPDVQSELDDIRSALNNINLQENVQSGRDTFESIINDIETQVSTNINDGVRTLDEYNATAFNLINDIIGQVNGYIDNSSVVCPEGGITAVFGSIEFNAAFIRECVINAAFEFIQQYDVYRYAFGIVICSLALVTILLAMIGIFMGMIGFRKDREPETRTGLSHCGGIFLLIGVCITFAFGFVLLLLCCIFFFFGSNAQKLCQAIESPEYPLYQEVIDNREFWGGSLIGSLVPSTAENPEIFLSQVLNNCEANQGLFAAANLSLLLGAGNISQEISNLLNLNQIRESVSSLLGNATNDFNFTDTSFLPMDAQNALDEFRNASVDQINITAYREQIEAPLVSFNVSQSISDINDVIASLSGIGGTQADAVIATLQNTVTQLIRIRDIQIPNLQSQVNQLDSDVRMLEGVTDTVVTNTSALVDNINAVISNITTNVLPNFLDENLNGAVDEVFLLIDSYLGHIDNQLSSNVGRCQPLWGIYDQLYGTVCRDFLEGLNGFWWSLGFCSLLFLPIIIFSVLTSSYYLKKKTDNDEYEDYPMKSF